MKRKLKMMLNNKLKEIKSRGLGFGVWGLGFGAGRNSH